jgi:hypothetical protein
MEIFPNAYILLAVFTRNKGMLMIVWKKPDIKKVVDASLDSYGMYDRRVLKEMLACGRLTTMTADYIRDNVYNIPAEKRNRLKIPPSGGREKILESRKHKLELPAPVIIFIAGRHLLFSGFDMIELAHKYNFPLKVWVVEEILKK